MDPQVLHPTYEGPRNSWPGKAEWKDKERVRYFSCEFGRVQTYVPMLPGLTIYGQRCSRLDTDSLDLEIHAASKVVQRLHARFALR